MLNALYFVVLYNGSINAQSYLSAVVAAPSPDAAVEMTYNTTNGWDKSNMEVIICVTLPSTPANKPLNTGILKSFES
jgi:hypothetical protein